MAGINSLACCPPVDDTLTFNTNEPGDPSYSVSVIEISGNGNFCC